MLTLLRIKNIALIDELAIEFGAGLNLLTGETGSGKSIIVDSLGALTGARISNDLIKEGQRSASIEGLFTFAGDHAIVDLIKGITHRAAIVGQFETVATTQFRFGPAHYVVQLRFGMNEVNEILIIKRMCGLKAVPFLRLIEESSRRPWLGTVVHLSPRLICPNSSSA